MFFERSLRPRGRFTAPSRAGVTAIMVSARRFPRGPARGLGAPLRRRGEREKAQGRFVTGREVRREAPGWPVAEFRHGAHVTSRSLHPRSLYQEITDKIIAELEQGRLPWVQPWSSGAVRAPLAMPKTPRPVATAASTIFPWRCVPFPRNKIAAFGRPPLRDGSRPR